MWEGIRNCTVVYTVCAYVCVYTVCAYVCVYTVCAYVCVCTVCAYVCIIKKKIRIHFHCQMPA